MTKLLKIADNTDAERVSSAILEEKRETFWPTQKYDTL
jgi:hypothetical protein